MSDDELSYEVQVLKGAHWSRYSVSDTMPQAQGVARAALEEKKYLEAYRIICERRDPRTNKINVVTFKAVTREQVLDGQPGDAANSNHEIASTETKKSAVKISHFKYYLLLYTVLLLAIVWGGYFAIQFLQAAVFSHSTPPT